MLTMRLRQLQRSMTGYTVGWLGAPTDRLLLMVPNNTRLGGSADTALKGRTMQLKACKKAAGMLVESPGVWRRVGHLLASNKAITLHGATQALQGLHAEGRVGIFLHVTDSVGMLRVDLLLLQTLLLVLTVNVAQQALQDVFRAIQHESSWGIQYRAIRWVHAG